jgi:hypothetical protein
MCFAVARHVTKHCAYVKHGDKHIINDVTKIQNGGCYLCNGAEIPRAVKNRFKTKLKSWALFGQRDGAGIGLPHRNFRSEFW